MLVVDDNADALTLTSILFQYHGHPTRTAVDGEMALAVAEEFKPDVVVLDLGLPQIDGFEVCRRMKQKQPAPVIVAVSGWNHPPVLEKVSMVGFDGHFTKPAVFDELYAAIQRLLAEKSV